MSGLYVHVPFCARACPYCDFDFVVGRAPPVERYLEGLERERLGRREEPGLGGEREGDARETSETSETIETIETVYLGGGTPSSLGPDGLDALLSWIEERFPGAGRRELTVELNPEHVSDELLARLSARRVGRVSLGVQTTRPGGLRELGRAHGPEQARAAIERATSFGLCVSADLIVGWRGQSEASLRADIDAVLDAGARHISIYALTVESGTPWELLVARGKRALPDPEHQAAMLELAESALTARGFEHYEVASYALAGARALHNVGYWTWRDYIGLGPSAHSARFTPEGGVLRRGNQRGFETWLLDPARPATEERLEPRAAAIEGLWTGLRVLPGIVVDDYLDRFRGAIDRDWLERRVEPERRRGNLQWVESGAVLRVAPGRWLWHDSICANLLA